MVQTVKSVYRSTITNLTRYEKHVKVRSQDLQDCSKLFFVFAFGFLSLFIYIDGTLIIISFKFLNILLTYLKKILC